MPCTIEEAFEVLQEPWSQDYAAAIIPPDDTSFIAQVELTSLLRVRPQGGGHLRRNPTVALSAASKGVGFAPLYPTHTRCEAAERATGSPCCPCTPIVGFHCLQSLTKRVLPTTYPCLPR